MPLPIWLIPAVLKGAAVVAGVTGAGTAVSGVMKMKDANETMETAKQRHERNEARFEKENEITLKDMDKLGKLELEILHSFGEFSDVFEKIKNRPEFSTYSKNGITLPRYNGEKIKEVSVGAGVLLGGIGGAGLGAAGGFAAAGATTAAVMALGTASTGTAIASLSGVAATNATLALLGGGTLAMGGGGMAAGTAVLGAATLGVGLLVGGILFNFTGEKISDKADEAWAQMKKAEEKINAICSYLVDLRLVSNEYYETIARVNGIYQKHLIKLKHMVIVLKHTDWNTFTLEERKLVKNTVLLVGLLFNMCKVELVIKSENENGINAVNKNEVRKNINNANITLSDNF